MLESYFFMLVLFFLFLGLVLEPLLLIWFAAQERRDDMESWHQWALQIVVAARGKDAVDAARGVARLADDVGLVVPPIPDPPKTVTLQDGTQFDTLTDFPLDLKGATHVKHDAPQIDA